MRAVNRPQSWWGWHGWDHPIPLSIVEIIEAGTLPPRLAAAFWLGMERGASFVFAAHPPGAGKTALLTAILPFAPRDSLGYFTRGWGETFDVPPCDDNLPTYLLVNEMSDDLPVYSWGPYVVRIFEFVAEGYTLGTTMHADTADEVAEILEEEVGVPAPHLARLTFVVPLVFSYRGRRPLRRVLEATLFDLHDEDLVLQQLATWDKATDSFSVLESSEALSALAARLRLEEDALTGELDHREAFLTRLLNEGVSSIEAVQEAIEGFTRS
jgi:hypothetical protein